MDNLTLIFFFISCLALLPSCQKQSSQSTSALEGILLLSQEDELIDEPSNTVKAPRPKVVQLPDKH